MKLLLTAIVKDDSESQMFNRMLDSFMPYFQGLAVAVTGLSGRHKKLEKIIKKHGGKIVFTTPTSHPEIYMKDDKGNWFFANFSKAREASFRLAEEMQAVDNYDYWSWADADDILIGGEKLQEIAKTAKEKDLDAVYFVYWYSCLVNKDNNIKNVAIEHLRERLLKPGIWKWTSRLHEIALPKDNNYKPRYAPWMWDDKTKEKTVWAHLPTLERVESNLYRNVQILEIQAREEEHKDPRTTFYLAKTYIDLGNKEKNPQRFQLAEALLFEYMEKSGWAEERANAWGYLGQLAERRQDWIEAHKRYLFGVGEFPEDHLLLLYLCRVCFQMGDFEKSKMWLKLAVSLDAPQARTTIGNPLEIKVLAASMQYNLALHDMKLAEAIHWLKVRDALLEITNNEQLKVLEEAKLLNDAAGWIVMYARWLKEHDHKNYISHLLSSIPPEMRRERFVQAIANEIQEPKVWDDKSIVYFAASDFAEFNPKDAFEKGLGGSETAVIRLSQEWAKKGYKVTVFANVSQEGLFEEVEYKHWTAMNWKDTFNILILWRNPSSLDLDLKAKKIFLDLHDVASALDYNQNRQSKVHKIMVKSQYHRKQIPSVPDEKVVIISNGI